MTRLDSVCSLLFVPGNRPQRFAKAVASGAGAIILDIEDSVGAADKAVARDHVAEFFDTVPDTSCSQDFCPAVNDQEQLRRTAQYSAAAGMGGMMCIHPNQVGLVESIFAPSADQIEWAGALVKTAAEHNNSFQFRGQMVDEPVLNRARKILTNTK
jgi:citrate lyase beta subunit